MEALTPRSFVVFAFVLATLALVPPATAIGEEVYEALDQIEAEADAALLAFEQILSLDAEPRQEEAARERHEAQHPAPAEPAPASGEPRQAPASDERAPPGPAILRPVAHLLPVPITDVGAAPRLDLGAITSNVAQLAPLAPAPSADGPDAPAHVATASSHAPAAPAPPVMEPAALAFGATVAVAAAAPAAAGFAWERLRRVGWLALLYSRIAKERLLDHTCRERLLDAIRATPGMAVADLAQNAAVPRNTVTYHLRVLEREGLVSSTRNGRNRLYFAPGSLPQRANAGAFATLRHQTTLAMARAIGETPGVDQKALCERVGLSASLAHWHADRLVASGLVDKRREGRFVRYYPGASFELVSARSA